MALRVTKLVGRQLPGGHDEGAGVGCHGGAVVDGGGGDAVSWVVKAVALPAATSNGVAGLRCRGRS